MIDPYKVLGISRDADKDEIKRAYRRKAKEYHPDLHPGDKEAAEKMNEVNLAYDMLCNPEKYKSQEKQNTNTQRSAYGGNSYGGDPYGGGYRSAGGSRQGQQWQQTEDYGDFWQFDFGDLFGFGARYAQPERPAAQPEDDESFRQAIDFINMGRYGYANSILNSIVSSRRNARWYYLSALANHGLGNQIMAEEQIRKAIQMEPQNRNYERVLQSMRQTGNAYNETGSEFQRYAEGMQRMCTTFCMLQFFCMFCRC